MSQADERLTSRDKQAQETRQRILAAARSEFSARGYLGARLGSIGKLARVPAPLIHHYFENKRSLYQAVVSEAVASMSAEIRSALDLSRSTVTLIASAAQSLPVAEQQARLELLIFAFYDVLNRFFREHQALLLMIRAEVAEAEAQDLELLLKPLVDEVIEQIRALQHIGLVAEATVPEDLCLVVVSMVAFPLLNAPLAKAFAPQADAEGSTYRSAVGQALLRYVQP
jgi:AcrR family transcriptional regulator